MGGGQGRLIAAVLRAKPGLRGVLLDLPSVVEGAPGLLAEAAVRERCEVAGGDMFSGVPGPACMIGAPPKLFWRV